MFDVEPLPVGHPFRTLDNVVATPHIGYVTRNLYRTRTGELPAAAWRYAGRRSGDRRGARRSGRRAARRTDARVHPGCVRSG